MLRVFKMLVYANHHSLRTVLIVSLKGYDRYYFIYKLITLPTRIFNSSNFVLIATDYGGPAIVHRPRPQLDVAFLQNPSSHIRYKASPDEL